MELNFSKIAKAWISKLNPTEKEKELANKRWEICLTCPSRKEALKNKEWASYCSECGCPLSSKIFTKDDDACPSHKWLDVEKDYFARKDKKTLF